MCLCNTGYFECTPYLEVYCAELKESLDFDKKTTTQKQPCSIEKGAFKKFVKYT